jgi:hypothetical protein
VGDTTLKFFQGNGLDEGWGPPLFADEVAVDAPDDYHSLTLKTIEIVRWAQSHGFDYVFLCDTDTYVIPKLLLESGFENYDYMGRFSKDIGATWVQTAKDRNGNHYVFPRCHSWASGGVGYFLSRKAMVEILHGSKPTKPEEVWAEDLWVGQVMGPAVRRKELTSFYNHEFECVVSWHFPQARFESQYDGKFGWMEQMYKDHR